MTKKPFLKALLFFVMLHAVTIQAQNSFLYELKKPGNPHVSYLYGTIHIQDKSVFNYGRPLFSAIESCDRAVFEMELSAENLGSMGNFVMGQEMEAFLERFATYLIQDMVPKLVKEIPAEDFASFITDKLYKGVEEVIDQYSKQGGGNSMFLDMFLHEYAMSLNKEVIGLESMSEQIMALVTDVMQYDFKKDNLSAKMIQAIRSDDDIMGKLQQYISSSKKLVDVYSNHDFKELCNQVLLSGSNVSEFEKSIFKRVMLDRNDSMFNRSLPLVASGSTFIAVGSGHLCGSNGLIAQFEKAGYSVMPVAPQPATTSPIVWDTYTSVFPEYQYAVKVPKGLDLNGKAQYFTTKGMVTFSVSQLYDDIEFDWDIEVDEQESVYFEDSVEEVIELESDFVPSPPPAPSDPIIAVESVKKSEAKFDPKAEMTALMQNPEIEVYFKTVGEKVMTFFMTSNFKKQMEAMVSTKDTSYFIGKGKNKVLVNLTISPLQASTITATYETKQDSKVYKLSISGDRELVTSKEMESFFLSFKPVEGLKKAKKPKKNKGKITNTAW